MAREQKRPWALHTTRCDPQSCAPPPPPPTECRRRAGAVFVTCSRHVVLYTSYMLLDFCNAVYNEALTLTKTVRTMRACFAIALDIQMKHGSVKAKVFRGQFCEIES